MAKLAATELAQSVYATTTTTRTLIVAKSKSKLKVEAGGGGKSTVVLEQIDWNAHSVYSRARYQQTGGRRRAARAERQRQRQNQKQKLKRRHKHTQLGETAIVAGAANISTKQKQLVRLDAAHKFIVVVVGFSRIRANPHQINTEHRQHSILRFGSFVRSAQKLRRSAKLQSSLRSNLEATIRLSINIVNT